MNLKKSIEYFSKFNHALLLIPFIIFALILAGVVLAQTGLFEQNKIFPKGVQYVPDQIIVQYKQGQSPDELLKDGRTNERKELLSTLATVGVISQKKLFTTQSQVLRNYYVLNLKKSVSIPDAYAKLKNVSQIENAAPDYILKIQEAPDDPYYPDMWNLKRINMDQTWNTVHTDGSVTVAVIDTGVDYNHPDLAGIVVKGKNFIANTNDPMDDQGHGTHVAGILGAVTNNALGISGVSWGAKVLAIKGCDKDGNCSTTNVSRSIQYAVDQGVKIINVSIAGSGSCSGTYTDTLRYAEKKGVLVIAAAGNGNNGDGVGVDASTQIPASCDGVLTVGSITNQGARSGFSNYGSKVHIAAPGGLGPCSIPTCILSTGLQNGYTLRAGTSMAAPHVSGVAALLLANSPSLRFEKIRSCLVSGADPIKTDHPIGPLLNPQKSLSLCTEIKIQPTPFPTIVNPKGKSSISGIVFVDQNQDNKMNLNEKGYSGAQIVLSGKTTDSVATNSKGRYSFVNLDPGLYAISLIINGQSIGSPIDVTLPSNKSQKLDLALPSSFTQASPTPGVQKTASGCFIDPKCLDGKNTVQVCSFQCK